jgi:cell division septum initiation protein DivIVA
MTTKQADRLEDVAERIRQLTDRIAEARTQAARLPELRDEVGRVIADGAPAKAVNAAKKALEEAEDAAHTLRVLEDQLEGAAEDWRAVEAERAAAQRARAMEALAVAKQAEVSAERAAENARQARRSAEARRASSPHPRRIARLTVDDVIARCG